jgi:hypothetical protein
METKEQLKNAIREWVRIDNEVRALNKEVVKRKNEKKNISQMLIEVMKKHDIECVDINDGQICYTKKNVKKPITQKILMDILAKYYKGDLMKASQLNSYILENREETTKETIERKIARQEPSSH